VFSAFLGDHDRHAANYLLTKEGRLISIDHGMADFMEAKFHKPGMSRDEARSILAKAMELKIDKLRTESPNIHMIDKYINYEDVQPMIKKIKELNDDQLEAIVKAAYSGRSVTKEELAFAKDNLRLQQEVLEEVLRKKFPPIKSTTFTPVQASVR
jgi:predicted unusual protein kinase regulating ubiquinone biosynthesis (AarF/ABC1/UbiB family)